MSDPVAPAAMPAAAALMRAALTGDHRALTAALAAGAAPDTRDERGRTALLVVTTKNLPDLAATLLAAGADPNAQDEQLESPFLTAGAEGFDDIVRLTLAHGADTRVTNRYGGTALIPACESGHVSTVRLLLDSDVDVNHVNTLGWTALHEAIVLGDGGPNHVAVARLLLAAGAKLSIPDANGVLPRELAQNRGYTALVEAIDAADPGRASGDD